MRRADALGIVCICGGASLVGMVAENRDGTTTVTLTESLFEQDDCDELLALIERRLALNETRFILNFAQCPGVSSYGLGQLLKVNSAIRSKGGSCTLREVPKEVRDVFSSLFLDKLLTIE